VKKLEVDFEAASITAVGDDGQAHTLAMDSPEGFSAVSEAWVRVGWDTKYVYGFTWFGRPIIQLPEDLVRLQEVIYAVKPSLIIETGVAHGGGLIFYCSMLKAMGAGRAVGVDIEIRPHNRTAIEAHEFADRITLIEGSSVDPDTITQVAALVKPDDKVLVVLDSNHLKDHVAAELRAYGHFVSRGSYMVCCDGIMQQVVGAPRTKPEWAWNNPISAIEEFLAEDPRFVLEEPTFPFNEGKVKERITYWPKGFLKRVG